MTIMLYVIKHNQLRISSMKNAKTQYLLLLLNEIVVVSTITIYFPI